VSDNKIQDMQKILETSQQREKLLSSRLEEHQKRIEILEDDRHKTNEFIRELANKLSELQSRMSSQDIISLREIFPAGSADYQGQSSL
jgi:predicted nuclease with TOPRIM domain